MNSTAATFDQFRGLACVVLGAITGVLIGLPLAIEGRAWIVPVSLIAGLMVGYRRRRSVAFLYFCLVTILLLATVISFQGTPPTGRAL